MPQTNLTTELRLPTLGAAANTRDTVRRRIYLGVLFVTLLANVMTFLYQRHIGFDEPFVQFAFPALVLLTLADIIWLLMGGSLRLAEQAGVYVLSLITVVQILVVSASPQPAGAYANGGPYWLLIMTSVLAWLFLRARYAFWLSFALFIICVSLPWLIAGPYAMSHPVSLLRIQFSSLIVLLLVYALAWYRGDHEVQEKQAKLLRTLALTDSLTGLNNRRGMYPAIESLLEDAIKGQGGGLLLLDLDHFKRINDGYGHPVGDEVLTCVAQLLQNCETEAGASAPTVGRWGGEEFIVVMPGTLTEPRLAERAERLRQEFHAAQWPQGLKVTTSIGACLVQPSDTLSSLLARMDAALYHAKNAGRDCWVIKGEVAAPPIPALGALPAQVSSD